MQKTASILFPAIQDRGLKLGSYVPLYEFLQIDFRDF